MEWTPLSLSVEELALSVSLMGYPEDAATLLQAQFGEISSEKAQHYLEAASHSLLARGWAIQENGSLTLSPILQDVIQSLMVTQFSLQLQKRPRRGSPVSLTFHFGPVDVLVHSLSYDVVHQFYRIVPEDVLPAGWAFFEIPREQWEQEGNFGPIPATTFRALYKAKTLAEREAIMEKANLPSEIRRMLLEDLAQAHYRGLITLLEYDEQRRPFANQGAFVLQGPNRTWMFASDVHQEDRLQVQWMNLKNYQVLLRRLITKGHKGAGVPQNNA